VDRTTNGTGKVIDYTLEELRQLDAGIHKGLEFQGLKVPTFIEFMDYVKQFPELTLDLELKEYPVEGQFEPNGLKEYEVTFPETSARYLKVSVGCLNDVPQWHHYYGRNASLLVDEIMVN
jgi:glycerophosphoryl diester phosphodiesterase